MKTETFLHDAPETSKASGSLAARLGLVWAVWFGLVAVLVVTASE